MVVCLDNFSLQDMFYSRVDGRGYLDGGFILANFEILLALGGFFKVRLSFPKEYPLLPPKMKFESQIWHPNSRHLPCPISSLH